MSQMLVLRRFEIENFKSYQGKHIIGPFMHFTAIIGPNGSGKSNLMEAMSFVLGEKISKLRAKEKRELIYGARLGKPVAPFSYVKAYFVDGNEDYCICRRITCDEEAFFINEEAVTATAYKRFLESYGIYMKMKNFLVFQGDVEKVVSERPKERTLLLEKFSGSQKCAKRYDHCQQQLKLQMDRFTSSLRKKREAATEKRKLDLEKQEAGKYNELKETIVSHELELILLKLLSLDTSIKNLNASLSEDLISKISVTGDLTQKRDNYASLKAELGKLFIEISNMEKNLSIFDRSVKQIKPRYDALKSKISYIETKRGNEQKSLERCHVEILKTKNNIVELEQTINEAEKLLHSIDAHNTVSDELSPSQHHELFELKERAISLSEPQQAQLNKASEQRDALLSEIRSLNSTLMQLEKRQTMLVDIESDLNSRKGIINESFSSCSTILASKHKDYSDLSRRIHESKQLNETDNENLSKICEMISLYKVDLIETDKLRRLNTISDKLKLFFPGVHGRLGDLIEPSHRRYSVAIAKVLGRHLDAFVVDSYEIAFDCVEYLKEQRMGRAVFLPISGLKKRPINDKYRQLGGTAKLLIDTTKCESFLKPIVEFVFGNTIVCDEIDEARKIAFGYFERHKVVTLDGALFLKNGIISGGSIHLKQKARRWDEKQFLKLKQEKGKLLETVKSHASVLQQEHLLDDLQLEMHKLEQSSKNTNDELSHLHCVIAKNNDELRTIEEKIQQLTEQRSVLNNELRDKNSEIEGLETRIRNISKSVHQEFSEKYSISRFENFEETSVKQVKESVNRRDHCERHLNILRTQLEHEKSRAASGKIEAIQRRISEFSDELSKLTKEKDALNSELEYNLNQINIMTQTLAVKRNVYGEKNVTLKSLLKTMSSLEKQEITVKQELSSTETRLENLINQKYQLLKTSKANNYSLLFASGSLTAFPELASQSQSTQALETAQNLIYFGSEQYDELLRLEIDFSRLPESYQRLTQIEEIKDAIEQVSIEIENLCLVFAKMSAPNLKVFETYDNRIEFVKQTATEFSEIKQCVKNAQKEFSVIKEERTRLFIDAFNVAASNVDQIYKAICNDTSAQAYLTMDDPDDPYLSGISYNCVPPLKGYQSIEKLSGGEKALAALALLFALQSIHPPPFVIFDEVDAAFDHDNIINFANHLRFNAKQDVPYIVISLKEELFNKANALIGVTSDPHTDVTTSRLFSLNLDKYAN